MGTRRRKKLTHVDAAGRASMVDVGGKRVTRRRAVAAGRVRLGAEAFARLAENRLAKGDALAVARLAGIQAAKRTAEWIPLCHAVPLDHVRVELVLDAARRAVVVRAEAAARGVPGVEMEALVAVGAACLALYDMTKAIDRGITIAVIALVEKSGGKTGPYRRRGQGSATASASQRR
jgi:molybdenum cofactor biosynthesis protein MoaC